jgi:hypothetical protein
VVFAHWRHPPRLLAPFVFLAALAVPELPVAGQQPPMIQGPLRRRTDGFQVIFGQARPGAVGQLRCNNVIVLIQEQPRDNAEEENADQPKRPDQQPLVRLVRGTAEEFVFGQGLTALTAHASVDAIANEMIRAVDKVCSLSPEQRRRLELASGGEKKRFFDRAEAIKAKFEEYEALTSIDQFREWAAEVDRQIDHLHSPRLFGENSLFAKALNTVLTTEQAAALAAQPLNAPVLNAQVAADRQAAVVRAQQAKMLAARAEANAARLETILKEWEQAAAKIDRIDCEFTRFRYDATFEVEKRATGSIAVDREGRAIYKVAPAEIAAGQVGRKQGKNGRPFELKADNAERWHWTGTSVIRVHDDERTFEEVKSEQGPANQQLFEPPATPKRRPSTYVPRGDSPANVAQRKSQPTFFFPFETPREFPLACPFLLGMPVADLEQRFEIELVKETEPEIWLKLKPKQKNEQARLQEASLILRRDGYLPRGLKTVDPAGNETVHNFTNLSINERDAADLKKRPNLDGYRPALAPR